MTKPDMTKQGLEITFETKCADMLQAIADPEFTPAKCQHFVAIAVTAPDGTPAWLLRRGDKEQTRKNFETLNLLQA
jgi:hypothetical protein